MKVLGELCQCRLCRSSGSKGPVGRWWPCGCIIGQEADDHYTHKVEGVEVEGQVYPIDRVVHTNSRRATWIYLEDGEFVEWLPARRVGEEITEWYGQPVYHLSHAILQFMIALTLAFSSFREIFA